MSSVDSGDALDGDRVALLAALADRIDHEFADITQLEIAFRHRSWCAENGGLASNERLEFLGDAVLQLVVTERLFTTDPPAPEGLLAQRREPVAKRGEIEIEQIDGHQRESTSSAGKK